MFSSTYVCECTFSSLLRRKSKYRTMLSQESLESEIRCELCKTESEFMKWLNLKNVIHLIEQKKIEATSLAHRKNSLETPDEV